MKITDKHSIRHLNTDDSPENLQSDEVVDALNVRLGTASEQHSGGNASTLQGEVEVLITAIADIVYYGEPIGGSFIYSDGYSEVLINGKVWMKRNYDVNYPGSKVYDDDEDNAAIYGRLYTHNQIMSADFCPLGWHVPTEAEWDDLLTYLGGAAIAGAKIKEVGDSHWASPNTGATDDEAFRALPGGKYDEAFSLLQTYGLFWIADEGVPVAPMALNGSEIDITQFKANWKAVEGATGYRLDVSISNVFASFVAGYNNKDVGNVLLDLVTGLDPLTQYYYRARAYNEIGSSINSNVQNITTLDGVVDEDGNEYHAVTIGTQQWLLENLKTTKYADGTAIPNLTLNADWIAEDGTLGHDGAYCWYDNDDVTYADYGLLYNWYAVNNAHGLAPTGWRIPTIADINTLISAVGGIIVGGSSLKEVGFTHWQNTNTDATNSTGFTALGSGDRSLAGAFEGIMYAFLMWSASEHNANNAREMLVNSNGAAITIPPTGYSKKGGFSIRCVRDVV